MVHVLLLKVLWVRELIIVVYLFYNCFSNEIKRLIEKLVFHFGFKLKYARLSKLKNNYYITCIQILLFTPKVFL